ncbi:MAG: hypothetical protein ACRC2T_08840, partial [Thermoguttaceae bacterium]
YCGRVKRFLDDSAPKIAAVSKEPESLFAQTEPVAPKHKLSEGAELCRLSALNYKEETPINYTIGTAPSGPSRQRGSAASRTMNSSFDTFPDTQYDPVQGYPDFPDFNQQTKRGTVNGRQNQNQPFSVDWTSGTQKKNFELTQKEQKGRAEKRVVTTTQPAHGPIPARNSISTVSASLPASDIVSSRGEYVQTTGYDNPVVQTETSNFSGALKIIVCVIVVFFIIFHLVKLMSIIEEKQDVK